MLVTAPGLHMCGHPCCVISEGVAWILPLQHFHSLMLVRRYEASSAPAYDLVVAPVMPVLLLLLLAIRVPGGGE
jgi:hypothetical protein